MRTCVIDVETWWSTEHSLSKMNPMVYCTHPETEIISLAIKFDDYPTDVIFGEDKIKAALSKIDFTNTLVIGHNLSGFDSMILAWRLGVKPKLWGCTLAMARPIHEITVGKSLAKLVEHYGIGIKDNSALLNTKGRHLADFTPEEVDAMRTYNKADAEQCYALFQKLKPHYTAKELWHIDASIRQLVEPVFELDVNLLRDTLRAERSQKSAIVLDLAEKLGINVEGDIGAVEEVVTAQLASAPKFTLLLNKLGVEVPTKPSPTNPNQRIPAIAKSDSSFLKLLEHPDDAVANAARARLAIKSTLLETRIMAFAEASKAADGKLPIPINYCGATVSGRDSGWSYNPQNLPRVLPGSPKLTDALRNSMKAPAGSKVVVADLSGIELRVNMFLWKVPYAMALFAADPEKADLYKTLASEVLGVPYDEIVKMQRQAGKAMHLGCGFGLGNPEKYVAVAKTMAQIVVSLEDAVLHIAGYRQKHPEIVEGWKECGRSIADIASGIERAIDPWGLCWTCKEGIRLPSGRLIRYPDLRQEYDGTWPDGRPKQTWKYGSGRNTAYLTGPKVDENCIAEGTQVLTDSGWVSIEEITKSHRVHDGVSFVRHDGLVCKSVQSCVSIDGVYMTPDHEVLTNDGWKIAEQVEEPFRPDLRGVNCVEPGGVERTPRKLEIPVRVREADGESRSRRYGGSEARRNPQLRVHDASTNQQGEPRTRDEQAPSLCRLPEHDRPLQTAIASGMEKLRSAWDYCVRPLEVGVRVLLGRYGPVVPARVGFGPQGQQRAVLLRELPVGISTRQHNEQTQHRQSDGHTGTEPCDRNRKDHSVQQVESRLAPRVTDRSTRLQKPVYDVLNCGPRHRFVVRGAEGAFIVHNCVQALARDVLKDYKVQVFQLTGRRSALDVHDELVYVVPEQSAQEHLDFVQSIMRQPPKWWPELITWSEGDIAQSYGAAK